MKTCLLSKLSIICRNIVFLYFLFFIFFQQGFARSTTYHSTSKMEAPSFTINSKDSSTDFFTDDSLLTEICDNGIDDDGDGLIDDLDPDCTATCNLLLNGSFNNGDNNWENYAHIGNSSAVNITNLGDLSGTNVAYVDISQASGIEWHMEMVQSNLTLESGATYKIRIEAKAEANRTVQLALQLRESPWLVYWRQAINLTTTPQIFEFDNIALNIDATNVGFVILYGNDSTNFWIDNIVFQKSDCMDINEVSVIQPSCPSLNNGSILIPSTDSTLYSIDGGATFQDSNLFEGLSQGIYDIVVKKLEAGLYTYYHYADSYLIINPSCNEIWSEICDNGRDDDGDGLVDSQDTDCDYLNTSGIEICDNGIDDDFDGLIDWEDTDCASTGDVEGAFKFKIQLFGEDATGSNVWGVYVKPVRGFGDTDGNVTVSGQITILMENTPELDSIYNIHSINGDWKDKVDIYRDLDPDPPFIEHAYFFVGLNDEGAGIPLKNHQETLLFTFQTTQACPDVLALIDNKTNPHYNVDVSNHDFADIGINPGMDLAVFNKSTGEIYNWLGNYGYYAYDCNDCDNDGIPNGIEDEDGNIYIICGGFNPADSTVCDINNLGSLGDSDGDGLTDCEELTGVDNPNTPTKPFHDGDGLTSDPFDYCDPIIASTEDSDGDGLTDCEERTGIDNPNTPARPVFDEDGPTSDMWDANDPFSTSSTEIEICSDGIDNDGDGFIDCDDNDCGQPSIIMKLVSNQIDCNQRWVTLTATVSDTLDNDIGGTCSGATEYIFPYSESFENGIGSWSQASNDDVDWRTNSGPTSSAYTGPSGAAAGSNYYYIEASSNFSKSAILNSPCFFLSESRSADFKFKYHMYGTHMGSLKLEVSTDNGSTWTSLWGLSGDQTNTWHTATINLDDYTGGRVKLRFYGVTGTSVRSDIAIDDIQLISTDDVNISANATYSWNTGDTTSHITFQPTTTTTYTVDITLDGCTTTDQVTVFGQLAINEVSVIQPSCPNWNNGSITINATGEPLLYSIDNGLIFQESNVFTGLGEGVYGVVIRNSATNCTQFKTGDAVVLSNPLCGEICDNGIDDDGDGFIDCEDGDCGQSLIIDIDSNQSNCTQDDVTLTASLWSSSNIGGSCFGPYVDSFPYSESFENGIGSWSQASDDDVDWRTNSGPTSSANTGPSGAAAGSNYYYIESSSTFSKSAILNSPCFYLSESRSADFKFKYHMYGTHMGSLQLEASTDNGSTWTSLWSLSGDQTNTWHTATINLDDYTGGEVKLRFYGVTGTSIRSDIAIDDIQLLAEYDAYFLNDPTYSWNTGDTTSSITVNPTTTTTYSVEVTHGGCTASDQVMVLGAPIINEVNLSQPSCPNWNNGTITINATGESLLYSINGRIFQYSNVFTGMAVGTYDIVVKNSAASCTLFATDTVVLTGALCGEICDNGIDDDGDGKIDAQDPDCTSVILWREICDNGKDDDGDGLIDLQDDDCAYINTGGIEICDNGLDDDFDGLIDSEDTDCASTGYDDGVFKFKIQLLGEEYPGSNVWGVYVKPVRGFEVGEGNVTASGQITILMENTPALDSIYNIQSINANWNEEVRVYRDVDPGPPFIEHAYFSVGLDDEGAGIPLENHQETLLFTFQTTQACPDVLALFDNNTNPYHRDYLTMGFNAGMDLTVFNTSTGEIYNWLGNYGYYAYDCNDCDNDRIPNGIEDEDGNIYITCGGYSPTDSIACDPNNLGSLEDSDGDGLTNCEEVTGIDNPNTPAIPLYDGDGPTSEPFNICDPITAHILDSDGDGLTDCEELSGIDNPNTLAFPIFDEDGPTSDMNDPHDPYYFSPYESCFDGIDNNGDGRIDCEDEDCGQSILVDLGPNQSNCNQSGVTLNASFISPFNIGGSCAGPSIDSFPYLESFENGMGSWSNDISDDINWIKNNGSTSSNGTDPRGAAEGSNYLYFEATNSYNKVAILNGPCFDLSKVTSAYFSFQYYLYGDDMGSFDVEASTDNGNTWTSIWGTGRFRSTNWRSGIMDLKEYTGGMVQLRFNGLTGTNYRTDIAIDDIELRSQNIYFLEGPTYSWNTGETTSSITVNPLTTTTYTVEVTHGLGNCTTSDQVTVFVQPTIDEVHIISPTCSNLNGGSIIIPVTGDSLEYSIDNGTNFQHSNIFTGLNEGSYSLAVRNRGMDCPLFNTKTIILTNQQCIEICDNGIDDDGDGLIDCEDSDCGQPTLISVSFVDPENCPAVDNGTITILAIGANLEYSINDGATFQTSNIFTGLNEDSYDVVVRNFVTNCSEFYVHTVVLTNQQCIEICDNNIDDDGDGKVDNEDSDCTASFNSLWTEICDNGRDDDGDGLIDIEDDDCNYLSTTGVEICENGIDDDFDGLIDWEDPDCTALDRNGAFKFKIQLFGEDATGSNVWGVYVKPVRGFDGLPSETVTASGQITILMENTPALNSIYNIQSIHGSWNNNYDVFRAVDLDSPLIEHAYFSVGLNDEGAGIPLQNYQETLLFTFQTTQTCPDILALYDNNNHLRNDAFLSLGRNLRMDLAVFNTRTGYVYNWLGNYGYYAYDCKDCDNDGIPNGIEDEDGNIYITCGGYSPTDSLACDPNNLSSLGDSDGDGLTNCEEVTGIDNPNTSAIPPNDGDGPTSEPFNPCDPITAHSLDSDGDGLTNCEELSGIDNPNTPAVPILDADGPTSDMWDPNDPFLEPSLYYNPCDSLTNNITIICPQNITVNCDTPLDSILASSKAIAFPNPIDSSMDSIILSYQDSTFETCSNNWDFIRNWQAIDTCGNQASCTWRISIEDNEAPFINCIDRATVSCELDELLLRPYHFDNCSPLDSLSLSYTEQVVDVCGNARDVVRLWTVVDECGNTSTCQTLVFHVDTEVPIITCAPDITIECGLDSLEYFFEEPIVSDNCSTVDLSYYDTTSVQTVACLPDLIRVWTATDECGNISTCQQLISIVDTIPPVLNCPSDISISCDQSITTTLEDYPTVVDNCMTMDTSMITYEDVTAGFTDPCSIYAGDIVRTWSATDNCGNEMTCQQIIFVSTEQTRVYAKLYLEGFYNPTTDEMHTKLKDHNLLPTYQPFGKAPWNYFGTDSVTNFPANVVDWVLIMSRDSTGKILDQSAGFVNREGAIVSTNGTLGIPLFNALGSTISVHHCSHLAILSDVPYLGGVHDFTEDAHAASGNQQLKELEGKYVLYAGDYDASGVINSIDYNLWKLHSSLLHQYLPTDGDGNMIINNLDYNLWTNNKSKIGEQLIRY